ncbi:methyltransferase domain-containing protein [Amycolatopsis acidicola]|uniref:Methyltransferase domain-containing protein n=1 Tax=Amycolatopsis acidicola TaxID=2596893 RepID=A0A5N0UTG2_9PSEU|nr:methyltransferase domain-containing protein [Amycolatopsis acidicola]KAA9154416.1 methyltransferase domain-containing protein [Amycolatopsis acidicola]
MISRERLRTTFDEDAEAYDRARPGYPAALFGDLEPLLGRRVLEIGCGTGQLTVPLARAGHTITAVDLGAGMAAVARRKLAGFPGVEVAHDALLQPPPNSLPRKRIRGLRLFRGSSVSHGMCATGRSRPTRGPGCSAASPS